MSRSTCLLRFRWLLQTLLLMWVSASLHAAASAPVLQLDVPHSVPVALPQIAQYTLEMAQGSRAIVEVQQTDLDVVIAVLGPDGGRQTVDQSGKGELEKVQIDAGAGGVQRIEIAPFVPTEKGSVVVRLLRVMNAQEVAAAAAEEERQRQQFVAWVKAHALRLRTPMARSGFGDLQGLGKMIGDAHLVAMGEPTHGSREVFQLKHRLFEYLVNECGFTAIAFELSMAEARAVDRYIRTGEGDPAQALAGTYFWIYNTEEVLDLIQWMRAYNLDPAHARKLRFYGMDMQTPVLAARAVQSFLSAAGHSPAAAQRDVLAALADPLMAYGAVRATDSTQVVHMLPLLDALGAEFDRHATVWSQQQGTAEFAWARQALRILVQNLQMRAAGAGMASSAVRDQAMADNVRWALDQEGDGGRLAVWAHNFHVQKLADPPVTMASMGQLLAQKFKDDAVFMGIRFNRGGLQATDIDPVGILGRRDFIAAPVANTLEATLSEAGLSYALIDLRAMPAAEGQWLQAPRGLRDFGSGASDAVIDSVFPSVPARQFDLLAFIEATTPARALPTSTAFPQAVSAQLIDGGFEAATTRLQAAPWLFDPSSTAFGYSARIIDEGAHEGARFLRLIRDPAQRFAAKPGFVTSLIDARMLRGKLLTLKLWSRFEAHSADAAAYIALESLSTLTSTPEMGVAPDRVTRLRPAAAWHATKVRLKVSDDATHLRLRFLLAGDGELDIDAVTLSQE